MSLLAYQDNPLFDVHNEDKIIIDLCGGTGRWSDPYAAAGYDRRIVTLPDQDVRLYIPPPGVYGILAAPPCTKFAISGNRWKRSDNEMMEALALVDACLRIIVRCQNIENNGCKLQFWALENPVGKLMHYLGKWRYTFQPYEYGDPWTKRTCIWGDHNEPVRFPVKPTGQWTGRCDMPGIVDHFKDYLPADWVAKLPPSKDRATLRSMTPPGFAKAFFNANR